MSWLSILQPFVERHQDRITGVLSCFDRVFTWAPFRLHVYFNGHSWLIRGFNAVRTFIF
jgi:hypothetical protein